MAGDGGLAVIEQEYDFPMGYITWDLEIEVGRVPQREIEGEIRCKIRLQERGDGAEGAIARENGTQEGGGG